MWETAGLGSLPNSGTLPPARLLFQGGTKGVLVMPYIDDLLGEECKTGVYCWTCRPTNKRYVGSGAGKGGCLTRKRGHRSKLRKGTHCNKYLQYAWDKYGEAAFEFRVIETCSPEQCLEREQFWIDFYRSAEEEYGYNLLPTAGSLLGSKRTKETKQKISDKLRGHPVSDEVRALLVAAGRNMSEETKKRMSESHKGKVVPEEVRAKISETLKKRDPEINARIGEANRGKSFSPERRANISAALKGRKLSTEHVESIRRAATNPSLETRARMSAAAMGNNNRIKNRVPKKPLIWEE